MDYERYLVRSPLYEVFGGWQNRQSPAMTLLSQRQVPEASYYLELGWVYGLPESARPLREHIHDHDEILLYLGGSYETPQVLGAEIEIWIGGQRVAFNTSTAMYIPAGTPHGPISWKRFLAPHLQMAMLLGTGTAPPEWTGQGAKNVRPVTSPEKRKLDYEQFVVRSPLREAGAEFVRGRTSPTMTYMSGLQVPGVKYYMEIGWTFDMPLSKNPNRAMPEMVHRNYDEIVLHVGGDPSRPEELGGDIDFYVGGRRLSFNTTTALFIPRGLHHGPIFCRKYRWPHLVMAIMCGAGTLKEGWGGSFITRPGEEFA